MDFKLQSCQQHFNKLCSLQRNCIQNTLATGLFSLLAKLWHSSSCHIFQGSKILTNMFSVFHVITEIWTSIITYFSEFPAWQKLWSSTSKWHGVSSIHSSLTTSHEIMQEDKRRCILQLYGHNNNSISWKSLSALHGWNGISSYNFCH